MEIIGGMFRSAVVLRATVMVTAIVCAMPGATRAESFSLEGAVAHALAHNNSLKAARARAEAAGAQREVAAGATLPELGASYAARRSDNPLDTFADKLNTRSVTSADFDPARLNHPDTSTLYASQLAVRMPVYQGGRLNANTNAASAQARAAQLEYERSREVTAFEAERAYRALQAAAEGVRIADDAVAAAEEHARTTAKLVREGRTVLSDRLTAEVHLGAMRAAREQALTRAARARDGLRIVIGLSMSVPIEVAPLAPAPPVGLPTPAEESALARRKDLEAIRALNAAAEARVSGARAAHLPRIDVMASSNWYDDEAGFDNRSSTVMGVVSLDLYAGGRHQAGIAAAKAEQQEQESRVRTAEDAVRADVRATFDRLREAHARHAIARDNVERAWENVRLVKARYGQGRTILIDLLQAERALVEARQEDLASRVALETGVNALRLAEGTLEVPVATRQ